jgi:hypothetical protein
MTTRSTTTTRASRGQALRRAIAGTAALVAAVTLAACSDAPSAPGASPAAAAPTLAKGGKSADTVSTATSTTTTTVLATPASAQGVLRTTPLADTVKTTFTITPLGGSFSLPGTGLTVYVPPNAYPAGPLTITATAVPGDVVAYEFEPHGVRFALPLVAIQDLTATNWQSKGIGATYDVGYFSAATDLNVDAKTALVRELLPRSIDVLGVRLIFQISHFSGYMVAWGCR